MIEEESGFVDEGWLRMMIGIKVPAKKKKIIMFGTESAETVTKKFLFLLKFECRKRKRSMKKRRMRTIV